MRNDQKELFFKLFKQWMCHNGYSYSNAAARLNCKEKHIAWMMNETHCPNMEIVVNWLSTLLENYSGDIIEIYKSFENIN